MTRFKDIDSEGLILGAMPKDDQAKAVALAKLSVDDFTEKHTRELFSHFAAGKTAYAGGLSERADQFLLEVESKLLRSPSVDDVQVAVDKVLRMAARRDVGQTLHRALMRLDKDTELTPFVGEVTTSLVTATAKADVKTTFTMRETVQSANDMVDEWMAGNEFAGYTRSGIPMIDNVTGGLAKGHIFVLGADSSVGKTALMLQMLRNIALHNKAMEINRAVVIVELEMMKEPIAFRLASMASGVNWQDVRRKRTSDTQSQRWRMALNELEDLPLIIEKMPRPTPKVLQNKMEAAMLAGGYDGIDAFGIDYAELMAGEGSNETAQLDDIITGVKALIAEHFDAAGIVLSQLVKGVQHRPDRMPRKSDLRQSGTVEFIANAIGLLYRPARYQTQLMRERGEYETRELKEQAERLGQTGHNCVLAFPKDRDGEAGAVAKMYYHPQTTTFFEDEAEFRQQRGA